MAGRLKNVIEYPKLLVRNRDLLGAFVFRELKSRFEGSLLGRLWPILNPVLFVTIYYVVFVQILQIKYTQLEMGEVDLVPGLEISSGAAMGLYLITGILPWLAFSETMLRATNSVIEHANLIKKVAFPSELLVTYISFVSMIYFLISLPIYLVLHYSIAGWICPHAVWLPLVVLLQLVFTIGLGMLLAALNVFIRDTAQFVGLGMMLWMFLTPIFYLPAMATAQLKGVTATLFSLNPMLHLMALYRSAFLVRHEPFPLDSLLTFAGLAFAVLILGLLVFQSTKGRFADEV